MTVESIRNDSKLQTSLPEIVKCLFNPGIGLDVVNLELDPTEITVRGRIHKER